MKGATRLIIAAWSASIAFAQVPAVRTVGLVQYLQAGYAGGKRNLIAAADKMPDADYPFAPSSMPDARTFGAVIAHAADGMFAACATAQGVANPSEPIEKTRTHKAEIVKALAQAIELCDDAFSALTDQRAAEYVRQGPVEIPRAAVLIGVLAHNAEMYGISTVYLRAKNIVPPASQSR
jgi:hypothetical protein